MPAVTNPNDPKFSTNLHHGGISYEITVPSNHSDRAAEGVTPQSHLSEQPPLRAALLQHAGLPNPMPSNRFLHWSGASFPQLRFLCSSPYHHLPLPKKKHQLFFVPPTNSLILPGRRTSWSQSWSLTGFSWKLENSFCPSGAARTNTLTGSGVEFDKFTYKTQRFCCLTTMQELNSVVQAALQILQF